MTELEKRLREVESEWWAIACSTPMSTGLMDALDAAVRIGADFEREECAKEADSRGGRTSTVTSTARSIARAIRARGSNQ